MASNSGLWAVVFHGLGFMALFTAFQTSGSFQTTVLKNILHDSNLGYESLAVIYAVFSVSNFFSSSVVHVIGAKWGMFVGGCFYALFIAMFLKPAKWSILLASGLLGFAAAVLWTAQGNFLSRCSNETNSGKHSGIFWALLQASLLIGNLLGFLLFPDSSSISDHLAHEFYLILFCVACGGLLILFFVRAPKEDEVHEVVASKLDEMTPLQSFVATFQLLFTADMALLTTYLCYSGVSLSFWSTKYPTMIGGTLSPGPSLPSSFNTKMIGLHGIILGSGEIIGGLVMGRLADKYGKSWVVVIALFLHTCAYYAIYANFIAASFQANIYLALGCSFFLGLGDSCVNTAIYTMFSLNYKEHSTQAFALYKCFQSALAGAGYGYAGQLDLQWQLLINAVFLLVGTAAFLHVDRKQTRHSMQGYSLVN